MEPGLSTFYHLVNDSLMPWLAVYGEEKQLRLAVNYLHQHELGEGGHFFKVLPKALQRAGMELRPVLIEDWRQLSAQPSAESAVSLGSLYAQQLKGTPAFRLFTLIAVYTAEQHFNWLIGEAEEGDLRLKQYYVMRSLTVVGQLIVDSSRMPMLTGNIKTTMEGIRAVLAFVWLKVYTTYIPLVNLISLSLFKEEVTLHLTSFPEQAQPVRELCELLGRLTQPEEIATENPIDFVATFPKTDKPIVPKSNEEIFGLYNDVKTELSAVMEGLQHLASSPASSSEIVEEYLRPKETCLQLGISKSTLNDWRKIGKITCFRLLGNRYEYSMAEINRLSKKPIK
ncbi:MAG: hypothetical protein A2W85_03485 [Bacteroidetes bacterium GWF2_41_31]|nr:MAG: hypothetical protein A2W85_03485 [Bacteroidetes bacterium GWF2_41_31]